MTDISYAYQFRLRMGGLLSREKTENFGKKFKIKHNHKICASAMKGKGDRTTKFVRSDTEKVNKDA